MIVLQVKMINDTTFQIELHGREKPLMCDAHNLVRYLEYYGNKLSVGYFESV